MEMTSLLSMVVETIGQYRSEQRKTSTQKISAERRTRLTPMPGHEKFAHVHQGRHKSRATRERSAKSLEAAGMYHGRRREPAFQHVHQGRHKSRATRERSAKSLEAAGMYHGRRREPAFQEQPWKDR
ncbi:uncharacterized protein LOC142584899 [Dermacentor variabilis]|uniref:uncharacterized protein LOC142584899 n=1 Tax=Dermacentor variabilis TaxID=34621 RepID=UPI003F5C9F39